MTKTPTMKDAIEAGDGTLHGAIDYWQKRALDAETELEAFQCADETTRKLADNYIALTCKTKRPYATKTKRRTYTVTDEVHEQLRKLGQGNASAGIREAVRLAQKSGH